MPSMSSETLQTFALIPNCGTHVLNNVFNVITCLVKQMSANLIHVILINIIQSTEANLFFKINCATVTKNIKLHILQNKSKQISNHILLKTAYTQHNITRFSKNYTTRSSFLGIWTFWRQSGGNFNQLLLLKRFIICITRNYMS